MTFTTRQIAAIESDAKELLILACAGSGKTSVAVERIARTIEKGTPANQIICIAYTMASAGELQRRIEARLGQKTTLQYVGTVHGLAARILKDAGRKISIMNERGTDEFVDAIYFEHAATKARQSKMPRKRLDEILKQGPGRFDPYPPHTMTGVDSIAQEVWSKMSRDSIYSYDALLYSAWKWIRAKGFVTGAIFLDEAQDSADLDLKIIEAITASQKTLIGDPSQAIFGWRSGGNKLVNKLMMEAKV